MPLKLLFVPSKVQLCTSFSMHSHVCQISVAISTTTRATYEGDAMYDIVTYYIMPPPSKSPKSIQPSLTFEYLYVAYNDETEPVVSARVTIRIF